MMPVDSVDGSISQFLQLSRHWELGQRTQLLQSIQPIADNSVIYAIWLIESNHRGNAMTFARFPVVFRFLDFSFRPGVVTPCYYFLHFLFSGIERFASIDGRLTNMA